jgi:DNA-binding transcriptional ArsR family regulator
MFNELDPILHSQLRLAVMSLLISVKEAEFTFIREKTNATAGNLSVQVQKLKDAGYIDVAKQFKDNYPQTTCKITPRGIEAFEAYVKALQQYLQVGVSNHWLHFKETFTSAPAAFPTFAGTKHRGDTYCNRPYQTIQPYYCRSGPVFFR